MAEIRPLRGVRFDSRHAGPIGSLLAPPYDVASANGMVPEFSISGIENADLGLPGNQHVLAANRYQEWLAAGVLALDDRPAIYIHRHTFVGNGSPVTRTGLVARVRLRDWRDGVVLPHERTNAGPRLERLGRLREVKANLSPLYFLYRDPDGEIRELIDNAIQEVPAHEEFDRTGGTHRLEALTDGRALGRLRALFQKRALFVADGHHRYEAALAYRDEMRRRFPGADGPWEYILVLLSAVEDPGVIVRPTHRVLRGGEAVPAASILNFLDRWFVVSVEREFHAALFRLALPEHDEIWTVAARPGSPHAALLPATHRSAWRDLGVAAVEGVLESILGAGEIRHGLHVEPVVDEGHAIEQARDGFALAAFLLPAPKLDQLLAVAEEGHLLPPKSTWFEPKAPAGLVINDFELSDPAS